MKEVKDLLSTLLSTLNEAVEIIEEMDDFEQKSDVLVTVDTAWNEISYRLHELS